VLLSLALVLAITGYSALVYGATRTVRQGATVSGVLMLVFAFLGGAFFSISSLPPGVRRVAPVSPFYWGTSGYQALLAPEGSLASVLPNVAVLAGLGALALAAGASLLRSKLGRGAL
jgi:ABC-2 type transport system permease protein